MSILTKSNSKTRTGYALFLAILIGTLLRLYRLDSESFGIDEALYESYVHCSLKHLLTSNIEPLYFLIVRYWGKFFGTTEVILRLSSVLFGSISIYYIYKLSNIFFSSKNSLVSAYLLAINPFAIYCSQNLSFNSFYLFLALLTNYYFFEVFKNGNLKKQKYFVISCVAAMYSHPFSFFLYISIIVNFILGKYFKIIKIDPRIFIKNCLIIALFISPVVIYTITLTLTSYTEVGNVDIKYLEFFELLILPARYFFDQDIGILILGLFCCNFLYLANKRPNQELFIYATASFFSTYGITWIISALIIPILLYRFTSAALIYFLLLMTWTFVNSFDLFSKLLSIIILILNFVPFYDYYEKPNSDLWRETSIFLNNEVKKDDLIITNPHYLEQVLKYYSSEEIDNKIINYLNNDYLEKNLSKAKRIWIVSSHDPADNSELNRSLENFGNETKFELITKKTSDSLYMVGGYPINVSLREKNNKNLIKFFD